MATLGNRAHTNAILEKYGFRFQKKYGQNFLIDEMILEDIIDAADITEEDVVVEIGPGIGTMTQYLCERAGHVLAVEIDTNLIPILSETLSAYDNVEIINEDILKVDLTDFVKAHGMRPLKVVANLPYYITTPIIMGLLESDLPLASITVMVQKEVADRMQEGPGTKDYGALSLAVQYYSRPEIVAVVPKTSFIPQPNVDSAVIRLDIYEQPPVDCKDPKLMFQIIRAAFNQRRKTLMNGLNNAGILPMNKEEFTHVLTNLGLPEAVRGEALTLQQFADLANVLSTHGKSNS